MNNTLIIYDHEGYIIAQMSGSVREPVGIPFMWVEIPERKRIVKVDVSGETHVPIFEDLPKSEIDKLRDENLEIKLALTELAEMIAEVSTNG